MWWYTLGVIVLWVVNPELRRVYDMYFGLAQIELLSILPLVSVIPHLWSITVGGGWRRLPRILSYAAWIWVGGFTYAFVIAIFSGNLLSGTFSFVTFVFPIGVGLWIAADPAPFLVTFRRLTRVLFALTTLVSIYGIVQYVVAPAWDVFWLRSVIETGNTSFGLPAPFQIRVFSALSDPGTLAIFLAWMLLLALPELSIRKPLLLVQIPIWLITFGLTLGRTAWLMVALGLVTYLIVSPRRNRLIVPLGVTATLVAGLTFVLPLAIGNPEMLNSLSTRFATFSNLENDQSRQDRQGIYEAGPEMIQSAPFGQGLGVLGASTRLAAKGETTDFDSGLLGRAVEMGLPGAVLYAIPLLLLFGGSLRVWAQAGATSDKMLQSVAGMALGVQVAFAYLLLAHDVTGVCSVLFWIIECLAIRELLTNPTRNLRLVTA
jgi:putative inorganic carbon (HCO3(-)) transporter